MKATAFEGVPMSRVMTMSLIAVALLGAHSRAVAKVRWAHSQPMVVRNVVQLKAGSTSGVIADQTLTLFSTYPSFMPQKRSDLETLITIKREACFGSCPVYSAQIYSDGTVVYLGEENVKVKGEQRHRISEDRVKELIRAFERIKYFSLKDKYEVDGNGRSVTDQPTTTTSISLNGKQKKIVDYYCAPKELVELEDLIDKLAGLYEYIGPL